MKQEKTEEDMIQSAVRLPRSLHEQLKNAGGERGMAEEIRRRLQLTFAAEQQPADEMTDLLLDLIKRVAKNLSREEPWWTNRFALDVFRSAINELLSDLSSFWGGELQPGTISKLQTRYGPNEKPEIIGRILARAVFTENANEQLRRLFADEQKG